MPRSITCQEKHPELFAQDLHTDPQSRKRKVPMEVLCLGYMRTGTACKSIAGNDPANPWLTTRLSYADRLQPSRDTLLPFLLALPSRAGLCNVDLSL